MSKKKSGINIPLEVMSSKLGFNDLENSIAMVNRINKVTTGFIIVSLINFVFSVVSSIRITGDIYTNYCFISLCIVIGCIMILSRYKSRVFAVFYLTFKKNSTLKGLVENTGCSSLRRFVKRMEKIK